MIKSNLDVAYDILLKTEGPIYFLDLWKSVCEVQGYSETEASSKIGKFYTNLFMDGRFITLGDNTWDLRDSYKFERVRIDMNDVYHDEEDDEERNALIETDDDSSLDDGNLDSEDEEDDED